MELLFYLLGVLCCYSYGIYPVILKLLPSRKLEVSDAAAADVSISLVITVHNEESRIEEKLINTLAIDYPKEKLEIIVASDFSTDATESIVESYAEQGVRLVRADERKGKEYAQLCGIRQSSGDVLVFSDVATMIPEEALGIMAQQFSNPGIGAVSSEDKFISNDGSVAGEGAYVKYEMWLRRLESERAGLVGLSGSFFAARREVCEEWDIYVPSDFNTALNTAKKRLRGITCPAVLGVYKDVKDPSLEYRRKQRTVIRGITAIARHPEVLNPFTLGMFAFQVWSHKIMRWGVPWFMLGFLAVSIYLYGESTIASLALYAQIAFYLIALLGWIITALQKNILIKIITFFVQTNLALAHASLLFLFGKRMTVWTPSKR